MSSYRDYLWVKSFGGFDDYCLTVIGCSTPAGVLSDLGARRQRIVVQGLNNALFEGHHFGENHGVDGVDLQVAFLADIGDGWTMMVQMPGYIGTSDASMARVVAGHEAVSHQVGMSSGRFQWWSGGDLRISFEPLIPYVDLLGVLADRQPEESRIKVVELIREVGGIDLDEKPGRTELNHVPGSFALAESLTGVRVTPAMLTDLTFTVAVVPLDSTADHDPDGDDPIGSL